MECRGVTGPVCLSLSPKVLVLPKTSRSSCDFHLCFTLFRAPASPIATIPHAVLQPLFPALAALGFLLG